MIELARQVTEWDRRTFTALNQGMESRFLDYVMPAVTQLGLGQVQVVIILGIAIYLGIRAGEVHRGHLRTGVKAAIVARRSWIAPLVLAYALGGITVTALKVIPRDRPWWHYLHQHKRGRDLEVSVHTVHGVHPMRVRGFPSGHTATTVGMATVLTILYARRRYGLWLAVSMWLLASMVALSRIYLASHWPLDIIAGAIVGIISGVLSVWICRRWALVSEKRRAIDSGSTLGDVA